MYVDAADFHGAGAATADVHAFDVVLVLMSMLVLPVLMPTPPMLMLMSTFSLRIYARPSDVDAYARAVTNVAIARPHTDDFHAADADVHSAGAPACFTHGDVHAAGAPCYR